MSAVTEQKHEGVNAKYPHYQLYQQCQKKVFAMGCVSMVTGGAGIYVGQQLVSKWAPLGPKAMVVGPIMGGCIIGYLVTKQRSKMCMNMWLSMEESLQNQGNNNSETGGQQCSNPAECPDQQKTTFS